jgi:ABC-2 type transport system permease protein
MMNSLASGFAATGVMAVREYRRTTRRVDSLIMAVLMPVMILLAFVLIFGGAMETGGKYVDYVVPAILVLCAGYGAANTAVSVAQDMTTGTIERFKTLPTYSSAVLVGHVLASVTRNIISTTVLFGVAGLLGFRPPAGPDGWAACIGILLLFIAAMTWVGCYLGLTLSPEAASGATFFMIFLPYISTGFVPLETLPEWIQGFAEHQPLTPVIETVRSALMSDTAGDLAWTSLAWWGVIGLAAYCAAATVFRKKTDR